MQEQEVGPCNNNKRPLTSSATSRAILWTECFACLLSQICHQTQAEYSSFRLQESSHLDIKKVIASQDKPAHNHA